MESREPDTPLEPLRRFFDQHGLGAGPIILTRIGEGHSNYTYRVQRGERTFVMRRPPPPPVPRGVHDVMREYRVLSRLEGVPAPKVLAVATSDDVIGVPFYVMEYVPGWVLVDDLPEAFRPLDARRRIADELVDGLAALHAVDVDAVGLADLGRPDGFVRRQLDRMAKLWAATRTRELPVFDEVTAWLYAHEPPSRHVGIVHSDYRLGNVMFAPRAPPKLAAILDWELATLGDQMVDVGYLSAYWIQPDDPPLRMFELAKVMRLGGFGTRQDIVAAYERKTGRSTEHLRFYEVLALWRLATMMEANYRRGIEGAQLSDYLLTFADGAPQMIEHAAWLAWGREPTAVVP